MVSHMLQLLLLTALSCCLTQTSASRASDTMYNTYLSFDSKNYRQAIVPQAKNCQYVREVPPKLRFASEIKPDGLDIFYQKYTEAYGIPVLCDKNVSDDALRRACYVLRFMLAENSVVREWFWRMSGRIAVIGKDEVTNDIPEHRHHSDLGNQVTRGRSATYHNPVSTAGEENILCYQKDRNRQKDMMVRHLSKAIYVLGAAVGIQGWDGRMRAAYAHAKKTGLFKDTLFMKSVQDFFAEGVQSYFNVQTYRAKPDGVHGPIATRGALKYYDPDLYNLIKEIFPCANTYLKRCQSHRNLEQNQKLRENCEPKGRHDLIYDGKIRCHDKKPGCEFWSGSNQCTENPTFMEKACKKSCHICIADRNCFDKHKKCEHWAKRGECSANIIFMAADCRMSCKFC
ncbi:hypothetical protein RRG08_053662 [Elysia crispata]|uniref:ShKT domain-containing protein n=1 Tax=Elysia crispata TaxID=231223 RepID=A0AAE0ZRH5_9GAST|nr:hypothetical protein RRG08_053662 [Elysia crispata]